MLTFSGKAKLSCSAFFRLIFSGIIQFHFCPFYFILFFYEVFWNFSEIFSWNCSEIIFIFWNFLLNFFFEKNVHFEKVILVFNALELGFVIKIMQQKWTPGYYPRKRVELFIFCTSTIFGRSKVSGSKYRKGRISENGRSTEKVELMRTQKVSWTNKINKNILDVDDYFCIQLEIMECCTEMPKRVPKRLLYREHFFRKYFS